MLFLILITFGVFLLFWAGDLYLTVKTVKLLGKNIEINPLMRLLLKGRGKFIYLFKTVEICIFLYLIWTVTKFDGVISFNILLIFILVYSLLVVNNAHVFFRVTGKESGAFKIVFVGLTVCLLLFIYLNYVLYSDISLSYSALATSNEKYTNLYWECKNGNVSITAPEPKELNSEFPELNLPIRRTGLE